MLFAGEARAAFPAACPAAFSSGAQQPEAGDEVVCRTCHSAGHKPCAKHKKALPLENAPTVRACSVAAACATCSGALAIDCARCDNPGSDAELDRRRRLVAELLPPRVQRVESAPGHDEFLYLVTEHFDVTSSLPAASIDKHKVDAHERLHVYGERLEQLRAAFVEVFELTDEDLPDHMRVFLFERQRDHAVIGPQETGIGAVGSSGLKQMGPEFAYSMWHDQRTMRTDEDVYRNVVHNTAHLLISQMRPMQFLGNKTHGWIDEGVAHWFEDRVTGECTNFCFEEVLLQAGAGFKGGVWRAPVRKLVDDGELPSFAALSRRNTDQLSFVEHAAAFAYVDFLVQARGGALFRDLVRHLKNGRATRDALEQVYGLNPLTIEAPFAEWVQANYPRR